ncbi:MAG: exo-alpha-sialidase, partial [Gemmatimonadota bacterium]
SMAPSGDDDVTLIWLDGRGTQEEGSHQGEMSLRSTTVATDGTLGEDVLLDGRTCDCCQTSLVQTTDALVAAYRDRSHQEIRDISVVRLVEGTWSEPTEVHDDGFHYPGCPVNGPQLATRGDTVMVAWFTAPNEQRSVKAAISFDGGVSFGDPVRIDDGQPLGRADVEFLDDSRAVVSWLERTPAAAEVRIRTLGIGGSTGRSITIAETEDSRATGFPRIAVVEEKLFVTWTDPTEDGGIRVVSVPLRELR